MGLKAKGTAWLGQLRHAYRYATRIPDPGQGAGKRQTAKAQHSRQWGSANLLQDMPTGAAWLDAQQLTF